MWALAAWSARSSRVGRPIDQNKDRRRICSVTLQTQTETDRQTQRERERERERQTDRHAGRQAEHCQNYVLLCFAMFCYNLLWFAMFLLCFAMFCYDLLCFCYVFLLCFVMLSNINKRQTARWADTGTDRQKDRQTHRRTSDRHIAKHSKNIAKHSKNIEKT